MPEWVQSGWIETQRTRYYLMAINEILNGYNYKSCKIKEHVKIQVNNVKLNHIKSKSSSRHFTNQTKLNQITLKERQVHITL